MHAAATMFCDTCSAPGAAFLVDADGHALGLAPGSALNETDVAIAAPAVGIMNALCQHLADQQAEYVFIEGSVATLALAPIPPAFVLVVVVGLDATTDRIRSAIMLLRDSAWNTLPLPLSVLQFDDSATEHVTGLLRSLLGELGVREDVLCRDDGRRRAVRTLDDCCSGVWTRDVRSLLEGLCARANISDIETLLGTGSFGSAYQLRNGMVLKLTRDAHEARATAALVDAELRRFPRVENVFQVTLWGRPAPFFGIVREPVEQAGCLEGRWAILAREACDLLSHARRVGLKPPRNNTSETTRFAFEADAELSGLGIRFGDYQTQNVGLLRGQLCFFDLSLAEAPPRPLPPLEAIAPVSFRCLS